MLFSITSYLIILFVLFDLCSINGQDINIHIKWYILGPFPCGMNEVDGIPIIHSSKTKQNQYHLPIFPTKSDRKLKFNSELADNGYIKWMKLPVNRKNNQLQVQFPSIRWNALVQSAHRTEILQWQAWLLGQFKLAKQTRIAITCTGLNTFWINKIGPIAADQYGNRPFPHITILPAGTHTVTALIRGKHQTQLQCRINTASNKQPIHIAIDSKYVPDIIDGTLASSVLGVTIQNLSPKHQLLLTNVDIVNEMDYEYIFLSDKQPNWSLLYPNQIGIVPVYIDSVSHKSMQQCTTLSIKINFLFEITSFNNTKQQSMTHRLDVRCRQQGQSFKFTFLDSDGSVQHSAAIHPLPSTSTLQITTFPVLINLHGTGVTASNSADSYKYKHNASQKDYRFGVENMWVLAPTRHGAHNWEGVGKNTAMQALKVLIQFTKQKTTYPADESRIIFAGHSMGAHGTWVLVTSFPDLALAVIPQSGWSRKEYYGDSNTLFMYDIQNNFVGSALKSILEATIQENAIELHVSNVKNVPCFVRVGSNDQVVHPWWSRRIIRLLYELYPDTKQSDNPYIKYHEVGAKEHWWWDTIRANDGGVANDEELRLYFQRILLESVHNERTQLQQKLCANYAFTLTVYNPASVASKNGVQILQTWKSYQKATVSAQCQSENVCVCRIYTVNVRRLKIDLQNLFLNAYGENGWRLFVDDIMFDFKEKNTRNCMVCSENENEWEECVDSTGYELVQRSPASYGPIRQVFESRFRIVYGTKGSDEMRVKYKEWALYLSNLWYMTGDNGNIRIHSDTEENINLQEGENILLIGDNGTNEWSKILLEDNANLIDFEIDAEFVRIGPCVYAKSVGFMAMFPIVDGYNLHLGAVIGGSGLERMYEIILMAKPTIPPMTRQPFSNTMPDYIVTDKDTFSKGFGGILAAGFWKFDWKWDASTSYMSFCHQLDKNKMNKEEL